MPEKSRIKTITYINDGITKQKYFIGILNFILK